MSASDPEHSPGGPADGPGKPAEPVAALFLVFMSAVLLALIGNQTAQVETVASFLLQPAFMPGFALALCLLFALLALVSAGTDSFLRLPGMIASEAGAVFRAIEFVAWFLAYVFATPLAGYLPSTLIFCLALTWRLGYRNRAAMAWALVFALVTVAFFKGFLAVKIPGGAVYEFLPDGLRNFMIIHL